MPGNISERDCHLLGAAGHLARKRGLIGPDKQLTCDHYECQQVDCEIVKDPNHRTIYLAQGQPTSSATPLEVFYDRLEKSAQLRRP